MHGSIPPKRFLVTAGGSRERIDRVRDWGNIFTGNTGYRIAQALAEIGKVDLVTSNRDHQRELAASASGKSTLFAVPFVSHEELRGVLAGLLATHRYDGVFMTAAVSDYLPQRVYQIIQRSPQPDGTEIWTTRDVHAGKVKSTFQEIAITGRRTEKLVDLFRSEWGYRGLLVKFKLEVGISREKLIEIGQASRRASAADYLVANTLEMVDGEGAGAYLLSENDAEWVKRDDLPARLARLV
jgi:phosphopantothenoylcysteine synthetase/decarboxylase